MDYKLEPHQEKVIEYGLKNPYFIMAVDPGGGKTLAALHLAHILNKKLLVVCPSYLYLNWLDEIKKFYGNTKRVDGIRFPRDVYELWDTDIAVTTYETAKAAEIIYKWADIVAFDEATNLKTMTSQRTEFAHRFVYEYSIDRVILMSGTPIKNRVMEFYSLLAMCNYNPAIKKSKFLERFPDAITFADYFSHRKEFDIPTTKGSFRVIKWTGIKNINELKELLLGIYIRIDESEFRKTDEPIFKMVKCDNKDIPGLAAEFEKFSSVYEDSVAGGAKMQSAILAVPHTVKYVKDLLDITEKVVVFTDHVDSCKQIAEHFDIEPIHGGVSDKNRDRIKKQFQFGNQPVIAATYGSFSEGHTLTASNHLVCNDPSWVPGTMRQAYNRINRMTQTKTCVIHQIITSVQSESIYLTLQDKIKTIKLAT